MHLVALLPTVCTAWAALVPVPEEDAVEERPAATSDLLGDVWGEENGAERKRWLAGMHRAAPDTDWRRIELDNARRAAQRRAELAARPEGGAPGRWVELGSRNQAGHTRSAALGGRIPGGGRFLYVGSANGGLWRGSLAGTGWTPLSDQLFGGVDEVVAIAGGSPAGEDLLVMRRGRVLFRSADGGATWLPPEGLDGLRRVHRLELLGGADPELFLLATLETGDSALLVSRDGGASFCERWRGAAAQDLDLWIPRVGAGEGGPVFLALGGSIARSDDGGRTFPTLLPVAPDARRVRLTGSEAGGPRLYLAAESPTGWTLYRVDGSAAEPLALAELPGFWGPMVAFSGDADVLLYGGLECRRSTDGGRTFQKLNTWGEYYADPEHRLHADVRGLESRPDPDAPGEDLCFISTDGGTYLSRDRGASVTNLCLEGLGVTQVYSTLTSRHDRELILVGTQDQGYQRGRTDADRLPASFEQLLSGDYGYLTSSDGTHELVYASYPGFILVQQGEERPDLLYPWVDLPADAVHAWMPPIVADPTDRECFYLLADRLYRYRRKAGPYWSCQRYSSEDFTAGGGRFLTSMAFAPSRPQRAYAGNDAGGVWRTDDGGRSWRALPSADARWMWPATIAVHPRDADRALVAGSGYSGPAVLATDDGGESWRPLIDGLPRTLVLDLAWAADGSGDLYAATESGAWRYRDGTGAWEDLLGCAAPATTYWSVEVLGGGELVRFSTYGRGIWDYHPSPPEAR